MALARAFLTRAFFVHDAIAHTKSCVSFALFLCLLTFSATPRLLAADPIGMLAILHPASEESPARLQFYSPDAQLRHELSLPDDVPITAAALSPDGLHFVVLSGSVSGPNEPLQTDLTLRILRTMDGSEMLAMALLPSNFPDNIAINAQLLLERDPTLADDGDLEKSVWLAFRTNLADFEWSPDGKQLAFSAAIDGPSSDLYLYDTRDNSVTRLTDGIEQVEGIRWSPDGKWIWHSTISYSYCQVCGGHHYAAAADGSGVVNLPGNDIYRFLAWVDGDSYLVTDQSNGPGDFALQRVDIPTGRSQLLWAGTHQRHLYDAANNRLGIIGTRGKTYDPNEQVFVVDLLTGTDTEYDDLASALAVEPWLAPLDQFPINDPCSRLGPIVYPCVPTPYDPLSPDGLYRVTENFAVEQVSSGDEALPPLPDLTVGRVLWRPDGAGYFITQLEKVVYRDLATGDLTWIEPAIIIGWLPLAAPTNFATSAATPLSPLASPLAAPPPTSTAASQAIVAYPSITLPHRDSTLDGNALFVGCPLRMAHADELTALTYKLLADNTPTGLAARASGLPLLLALEAYGTTFCPYADLAPVIHEELPANQALNAALDAAPPSIASFPPYGALPNLNSVALSPDGKVVATGHNDGTIRLWDFETGTLTRVLPGSTTSIGNLSFSSDSEMLAAADPMGRVQMWTVNNGVRSSIHIGRYFDTHAIAWRPYTHDLAVANGNDPVMIHPRDKAAYELLPEAAEALAYSPDGTLLAVALQPLYPPPSATPVRQATPPDERPIWIVDADTGELLLEVADQGITDFMIFTPDGNTLIVAGSYELRAWNLATGELRFATRLLDTPNGWSLTPDGKEIAILTRREGISFYDLSNGDNVRNLAVDASVLTSLAIHPVEGQLISGEVNGRPLLLGSENGTLIFRFGPPRARLATTSPTTNLVATADIRIITLYEPASQHVERELSGAENLIIDIAFSPDGKWLAAREETGHLLLWEVGRGMLQWRVAISHEWAGHVAFAPDGRLVTGGSDGVLRMIDPSTGAVLEQLALDHQIMALTVSPRNEAALITGAPNGTALRVPLDKLSDAQVQTITGAATVRGQLAYSPDGSLLALIRGSSATEDAALELWQTNGDSLSQTPAQRFVLGNLYGINTLAFSPDGKFIVTGAHATRPMTIWPVAIGDMATDVQPQELGTAGSTSPSTRLAFTLDGSQLFATDENVVTTLYSLVPSPALRTLSGHHSNVWDIDMSPNGQWAITAGDDRTVRVWDWNLGIQRDQIVEEPDRVHSVRYSPDGYSILVGSDDGVARLYDTEGVLQQSFQGHSEPIVKAIFRPDDRAIATSSVDGSVRTWNRVSGEEEWSIQDLPVDMGALAYSPDNSLLAGSAGSGPNTTIYLWDAATGEKVREYHGHDNPVIELAFSPDGTLLASASFDRTIKLWAVATGEEVATLRGHTEILTGLDFSVDGTTLASVAEDDTLRLWDVAGGQLLTTIDMPVLPTAVGFSLSRQAVLTAHSDGTIRTWLIDPNHNGLESKFLVAAARVPRATAEFTQQERRAYAIDTFVGAYPLSASSNVNLRPAPTVTSLIVQPGATGVSTETLLALTDERFVLSSTNQGESWRVITRLPITLTLSSLGIPARATDPLLITSAQGLYRLNNDGSLALIHRDPLIGVSYSHTNANELWAIRGTFIYKSEDGGATWSGASVNLNANRIYAPLLLASANNNPQFVMAQPQDSPVRTLWRGAANGFWDRLVAMPPLPNGLTAEQGMAWDAENRTLYLGGAKGELFASTSIDAPNIADVTATIVEQFGSGTRLIPFAVGQGPSLYVNLLTPSGPRLLRGTRDGNTWRWIELRLPLVAAG